MLTTSTNNINQQHPMSFCLSHTLSSQYIAIAMELDAAAMTLGGHLCLFPTSCLHTTPTNGTNGTPQCIAIPHNTLDGLWYLTIADNVLSGT